MFGRGKGTPAVIEIGATLVLRTRDGRTRYIACASSDNAVNVYHDVRRLMTTVETIDFEKHVRKGRFKDIGTVRTSDIVEVFVR